MDFRFQSCQPGDLLIVDDFKADHVIKPVLARTVGVLCCGSQGILLMRQAAVKRKAYVQFFACPHGAQVDTLDLRVGSKHVDTKPILYKDADDGMSYVAVKHGIDSNSDPFTGL